MTMLPKAVLVLVAVFSVSATAAITWRVSTRGYIALPHRHTAPAPQRFYPMIDFTLTDQAGRPVRDTDFRGKLMLVFFGYGHCPDVCPAELQNIAVVLDTAPTLATLLAIAMTAFIVWRLSGPTPVAAVGPVTSTRLATDVSIGGSFDLIDHTDRAVRDTDFRGQLMLVFFGYGSCRACRCRPCAAS